MNKTGLPDHSKRIAAGMVLIVATFVFLASSGHGCGSNSSDKSGGDTNPNEPGAVSHNSTGGGSNPSSPVADSGQLGGRVPAKTVTGCLQKSGEPSEFSITGEDGKTWGLHSKTVKLQELIGHKVTVTGSPIHEWAAQEKAEEKEGKMQKAAGKEQIDNLRVTSVKMISETCNK